jgi:hypothetical protein
MRSKRVLLLAFLLFIPLVEAGVVTDFLGSSTFAWSAALVLVFFFIGYWRKKHVTGDMGDKSAVGGILGSVIKWSWRRGGQAKSFGWKHKGKLVSPLVKLYQRIRGRDVGEGSDLHAELLSDDVLAKINKIERRIGAWEVQQDGLMQASDEQISIQLSMMQNDFQVLTQLEEQLKTSVSDLRARKKQGLPLDQKVLQELYRSKKAVTALAKTLSTKLDKVQSFYIALTENLAMELQPDEIREKFAKMEVRQLEELQDIEERKLKSIRASISSLEQGDPNLEQLQLLEASAIEVTGHLKDNIKNRESETEEVIHEEKDVEMEAKEQVEIASEIRELSSKLYKGSGWTGNMSSAQAGRISKKITKLCADLNNKGFKKNLFGTSIRERIKNIRSLHKELDDMTDKGRKFLRNKTKVVARLEKLYPTEDVKAAEVNAAA